MGEAKNTPREWRYNACPHLVSGRENEKKPAMTRTRPLIALMLLWTAAAAGADTWFEVRSPHFTVVTDAGEKRGREVAMRLEQMRAAFGVIVNRDHVNIPIPVEVVAFRSSKEIRKYSPLFNGKPVELAGYYQPGQDRNYIALDLSANNALEATFHEYGHMLLNGN